MYNLTNFFQPFNILTISYFFGFLIFFDIVGTTIKHLFIKNREIQLETRIINWLIGLSSFVFIWFLVGFIYEANRNNILISIVLLLTFTLPSYLNNRRYLDFIKLPKNTLLFLLLFLPLIPSAIVKSSLAPYYNDELNYHFISPYQMLYQIKSFWVFNGGTLMNAPRLMDNLYILTFSATHTYSVVRLLQFLILPTAIYFSIVIIRKLFGKLSAFLFTLIFISLPITLTVISTIGYVDFPSHLFMLIGLLLGIAFVWQNNKEYLILSILFWGMSIGTKYSSLSPFIIFIIVLVGAFYLKNKSLKLFFDVSLLLKSLIAIAISGGYWYIKNFIVYGNPIYPFLFKCWGKYNTDYCGKGSSFFGEWTTPIRFDTFFSVINELIPGNVMLFITIAASLAILFVYANKKIKLVLTMITASFLLEMLVLKYSSGFYLRYQQHMLFFLILPIILIASINFKNRILKIVQYSIIALIVISSSFSYLDNIRHMGSGPAEKEYFLGKINIYGWVDKNLPKLSETVKWCDNSNITAKPITSFDESVAAHYIRPFLMNCYWIEPELSVGNWEDVVELAKDRKYDFWTITSKKCMPKGTEVFDPQLPLDKLNNAIICNSEQVLGTLYHFDYKKL
jgi:hypothetical protein